MKPSVSARLRALSLLATVCALGALSAPAGALAAESPRPYIVVLKEEKVAKPGRVAQRHAKNRDADLSHVYKTAIEGYAAAMTPADRRAVEADPNVKYVVSDGVMRVMSQTTPTGISRTKALGNPYLDIDGVDDVQVNADVAVIDTGVDYDHPDLKVVARANCVDTPNNLCVAGKGDDSNGHGTHVAGIVGALDNGHGVVGIAPGARIWAVQAGDKKGAFQMSDVIAAVVWVTERAGQIEVANMSLGCAPTAGCSSARQPLKEAIAASVDAGIVYVASAGNSGVSVVNPETGGVFFPAEYPDVITVSALADFDGQPGGNASEPNCDGRYRIIDKNYGDGILSEEKIFDTDDTLEDNSNWGPSVDIAAPGACIYSTHKHGGYAVKSGTSMAAPHVAGAAAILAAKANPANRGDVAAIQAQLIYHGNHNWDHRYLWVDPETADHTYISDGHHEPLLDVSNTAVFNVSHPGDVSSIGATSDESGDLDVYVRSGDNEIYRKAYRSAAWGNWSTVANPNGEAIAGAPSAISRRDGSSDLFVKGHHGGIGFRNKWQESWTSWFPIYPPDGKAMLSSPAATHRPDIYDGLTMVVRGNDGNIHLKNYWESIPGGWSPWENLGAPPPGTASSPAITMHDETWLHLTVRGQDGAVWGKAWGTGEQKWSGWVNLGTGFTSAPAMATSRSGDEMYLFARKADNHLWMRKAVAGVVGWSPWESLGGYVTSDPAATSKESHGVSVFAALGDNRVYERRFVSGGWTQWMSIDDNCPPGTCNWNPGGPGTMKAQSVEMKDLVAIDSGGTANVYPGYGQGFDIEDPITSLEGEVDSALLDGKGHYVIDVADVNDDDLSDLVTVEDDGEVTVHLGEEGRTFSEGAQSPITYKTTLNGAGSNEPIAVADVDGDGFDDLIGLSGSGSLHVYKGNAEGEITTPGVFSSEGAGRDSALLDGEGSYFLDAIDVTGDGRADVVAANTDASLYVFAGQEDGKLAAPVKTAGFDPIFDDGEGEEPVGLGDVDGDGRADLLSLSGETLKLRTGNSDGTFDSATDPYEGQIDSSLTDGEGEELIGLLDHGNDGRADLVSLSDEGDLLAYAAQSDGTLAAPVVNERELSSVRGVQPGGHEFVLERPLLRRSGCEPTGCVWTSHPTTADVNGDRKADLLVVGASGTPQLLAGTPGGFAENWSSTTFEEPLDPALLDRSGEYQLDSADVDGDGRADLVTMQDQGGARVYRGRPDGTVGEAVASLPGLDPRLDGSGDFEPVGVADANGDGRADLIGVLGDGSEAALATYYAEADGSFEATPETSLEGEIDSALLDGEGLYFLGAADINGGGGADLVAADTEGTMRLFAKVWNGFAAVSTKLVFNPVMDDGQGLEPIGLGDVTGDGRADLAVLNEAEQVVVLAGGPGVAFDFLGGEGEAYVSHEGVDSSLTDGEGEELIGLLDYDGDGRADLVSVTDEGELLAYEAQSDGTFAQPAAQQAELETVRHAGPTGAELVSEAPMARRTPCASDGCHWPLHGTPEGDIDGDGRADLTALAADGDVHLFAGTSNGIDASASTESLDLDPALLDGEGHYVLDSADVDGDGHSDLVTVDTDDERVTTYRGTPSGQLGEGVGDYKVGLGSGIFDDAGSSEPIGVADVTGDGRGDLVWMSSLFGFNVLSVASGDDDGSFDPEAVNGEFGAADSALHDGAGDYFLDIADVTGDGRADLISVRTNGKLYVRPGKVKTEGGTTYGGFESELEAATFDPIMDDGEGEEPVGLGDVNGDGRADLVSLSGETLKLRTGKADGSFESPSEPYEGQIDSSLIDGEGEELVGLLDYDGDGRADLVSVTDTGEVLSYRAQSNGTFATPVVSEGMIGTVRHTGAEGMELVSERPLLRRAGCTAEGCELP